MIDMAGTSQVRFTIKALVRNFTSPSPLEHVPSGNTCPLIYQATSGQQDGIPNVYMVHHKAPV
jgi:hypothetical protein